MNQAGSKYDKPKHEELDAPQLSSVKQALPEWQELMWRQDNWTMGDHTDEYCEHDNLMYKVGPGTHGTVIIFCLTCKYDIVGINKDMYLLDII